MKNNYVTIRQWKKHILHHYDCAAYMYLCPYVLEPYLFFVVLMSCAVFSAPSSWCSNYAFPTFYVNKHSKPLIIHMPTPYHQFLLEFQW